MEFKYLLLCFLCLKEIDANGFNPFSPFGGGGGNSQDAQDLRNFQCPSGGRFAFKAPSQENCKKFYECILPGAQPMQINRCNGNDVFNKLSRSCVPKNLGTCNWCIKEGRHEDKTSKSHFIECIPGSVAIRYRCKDGGYDTAKKSCETTAWNEMDITIDAVFDPPKNIISFMNSWKDKEKEEDQNEPKSIEEGAKSAPKENVGDDEDDSETKNKKKPVKPKGKKELSQSVEDKAD